MADVRRAVASKKSTTLRLEDYVDEREAGACVDFAELYEASDALQDAVNDARRAGLSVDIDERELRFLQ